MNHMRPGTKVLNQDPDRPLTGTVIATPDGQSEPDGWIWVAWSNGLVCQEYPTDVIRKETRDDSM